MATTSSQLEQAAQDKKILQIGDASYIPLSPALGAPGQLDASRISFTPNSSPKRVLTRHDAAFWSQSSCTDHMLTARWTAQGGWEQPQIVPYGPLQVMPTAKVLQYASTCFEGTKVYRGDDGRVRLFRLSHNANRLLMSCTRISLPGFDPVEMEKVITALVAVEAPKWLPNNGGFLYMRPTMIGTADSIGLTPPKEALFYVILVQMPGLGERNPFEPLLGQPGSDAFQRQARPGLKLLASEENSHRAWPGGFGFAKIGANYGPSMLAAGEAQSRGYNQVLWLFGPEDEITEAGTSNFVCVMRSQNGLELITPPLDDKMILDGITRRSILALAQQRLAAGSSWLGDLEPLKVVERKLYIKDIIDGLAENRLVEIFACGTAFFVTPVSEINFRGRTFMVPMAAGESGHYAALLKLWMSNIMYGREQHEWAAVVEERPDIFPAQA